jgi:hypothetical protein
VIVIRYEDTTGNKHVIADQDSIPGSDVDEVINLYVSTKGDAACVRPRIQSDHVAADKASAKDDLTASAYENWQSHETATSEKEDCPDLTEGQP